MIPGDPETIKKLQELADRNIANGDWGDEVNIPGLPGEDVPISPEERTAKATVANTLAKLGGRKVPKSN